MFDVKHHERFWNFNVNDLHGSNAQKVSKDKVPRAVKTAFTKLHPSTKVSWEMEKSDYEAGFTAAKKPQKFIPLSVYY